MGLNALKCDQYAGSTKAGMGKDDGLAASDFSGTGFLKTAAVSAAMVLAAGCVGNNGHENGGPTAQQTQGNNDAAPLSSNNDVAIHDNNNDNGSGQHQLEQEGTLTHTWPPPSTSEAVHSCRSQLEAFDTFSYRGPSNAMFPEFARFYKGGIYCASSSYAWLNDIYGEYIFEFQGVDKVDGKEVAHFDVYHHYSTLEHDVLRDMVEMKHIDVEEFPQPSPENGTEARAQMVPYLPLFESKEEVLTGPVVGLNFHGVRYDDIMRVREVRLVARAMAVEDEALCCGNPQGFDSVVLQAASYSKDVK